MVGFRKLHLKLIEWILFIWMFIAWEIRDCFTFLRGIKYMTQREK